MEKDYGLNFSGTFIMRGNDDSCECGIKISDNDGFEYSNDFSGNIDEMTDFFYKDMVGAIMAHYCEKKKDEKEAKNQVKTSAPINKQDDYVARLRALEDRNRDLEAQLDALKTKDNKKENKKENGSPKKAKRVAPNYTSKRVRSDIFFDDIFRESFFNHFFDI